MSPFAATVVPLRCDPGFSLQFLELVFLTFVVRRCRENLQPVAGPPKAPKASPQELPTRLLSTLRRVIPAAPAMVTAKALELAAGSGGVTSLRELLAKS